MPDAMTKPTSRYWVLSLKGTRLSVHPTVADAARKIEKHGAWTTWSLAREDRHAVTGEWGGRLSQLTQAEHRERNAIRFPALTEYDGEPPA